MIRTIKENLYTAIKMNLNQAAMCVFGGMMSFAGVASKSDTVLALLSAFSIVFYLFLIYAMFYEMGQKDGIKINAQRLRYEPFKVLWISLFANSLNFLLGILAVVFKAIVNGGEHLLHNMANYDISTLHPAWALDAYRICDTLAKAIQIMYAGVLKVLFSANVFALVIIPIPAVLVAVFSYRMGVKYCNGFGKKSDKKKEERYKV